MKIIRHGYHPYFRAVCPKCRCVFRYNKTDMKKYESYLPKYVKCPECNATVEYEIPVSQWEF